MTDTAPRYRYWGDRKPVALARPAETVQMAAASAGKKTAQIRLYGPIDSWGAPFGVAASEVAAALDQAGDNTAVEMHVHSPGGEAFEGLAIMNLLRQHKGGVDVVVDGLAASAASIVCMGAGTVTMMPGAQMMIHDASALAIGQADDMREAATMLDSLSSNAADQYAAKSGKTPEEMRAAMKATTWLKAQEAVDMGLADAVMAPDDEQAKTAATAAAQLRFDLSIYPNAPAMQARCECGSNGADISAIPGMQHKDECPVHTQTPADPPVQPTTTEEADTMSDTIPKAGVIAALGLSGDVDEDAILDAIDEKIKAAKQTAPAASADDGKLDPAKVAAALADSGQVAVSQAFLDTLKAGAEAGQAALARQSREDRDKAIAKAQADGKVSRDPKAVEAWQKAWDLNPQQTAKELDELGVRFPVGPTNGFAGHESQHVNDEGFVSDDSSTTVWSDEQADALASLAGLPKGVLR